MLVDVITVTPTEYKALTVAKPGLGRTRPVRRASLKSTSGCGWFEELCLCHNGCEHRALTGKNKLRCLAQGYDSWKGLLPTSTWWLWSVAKRPLRPATGEKEFYPRGAEPGMTKDVSYATSENRGQCTKNSPVNFLNEQPAPNQKRKSQNHFSSLHVNDLDPEPRVGGAPFLPALRE